ncbi:hypothetical protein HBB16_19835 [Pseudonocardia sp. MCCB 268]|nr:hypothetical protein [Pseudonocardia cytotoxica]
MATRRSWRIIAFTTTVCEVKTPYLDRRHDRFRAVRGGESCATRPSAIPLVGSVTRPTSRRSSPVIRMLTWRVRR